MAGIHTMEVEPRNSLGNLPDDILHDILSFLNITELARLRALSRRFHTLSTTAPSFCFNEPYLSHHSNCSCTHVFNFMNTLPQHHPHAFKINRLCFSSFCERDEHRSLHDQWINQLFQTFHVDELSLYHHLPSIFGSLSKFQSLKSLKLEMRGLVLVKLPEMKLASLETLYMIDTDTEDPVGEWVSQSFPALKKLLLSYIDLPQHSEKQLDLTIRSSCLEDLSIHFCCNFNAVRIITENLRALSYVNWDDEIAVEISAPNLHSLIWKGSPPRLCYDARTFKSLHVANFTELWFQNLNLLIQLFEATRWARLLRIETDLLQMDFYGKPSISFRNVRHLEIHVRRWFYHFKSLSSILEEDYDNVGDVLITFMKITSTIETLTFVSEPPHDSKAVPEEYVFKKAFKMCEKRTKGKEIKGVKKVKFKITTLCHSMALLIGMLKTRHVDLEEMTLNYSSCYHESITLYLNSLENASSALTISCVSF